MNAQIQPVVVALSLVACIACSGADESSPERHGEGVEEPETPDHADNTEDSTESHGEGVEEPEAAPLPPVQFGQIQRYNLVDYAPEGATGPWENFARVFLLAIDPQPEPAGERIEGRLGIAAEEYSEDIRVIRELDRPPFEMVATVGGRRRRPHYSRPPDGSLLRVSSSR